MRIAQVAPLAEAVPPLLYGGTERIVSYLTEELVALGHEVTLFASGDSRTAARLEAAVPRALRLGGLAHDPSAPHVLMLALLLERLRDFDMVHFHLDHLYDCHRCGTFTAMRPMAEFRGPCACPTCGCSAPRASLSAPSLVGMDSARRNLVASNERGAKAAHPAGCGCCVRRWPLPSALSSKGGASSRRTVRQGGTGGRAFRRADPIELNPSRRHEHGFW